MVCIDSDVLIDLLRDNKETERRFNELRESGEDISTTSINCFELQIGVTKSSINKLPIIKGLIQSLNIYNFDS